MSEWIVYVCLRGTRYYTGITTDLAHRLHQHHQPELKYAERHPDQRRAAQRERAIKGWSRDKKERLWVAAER
jgi:predicted GIY-YIG superfamily endonuclease